MNPKTRVYQRHDSEEVGKSLDAMMKQAHQITRLQNCVEDLLEERKQLQAQNAQMVEFITAAELWLETFQWKQLGYDNSPFNAGFAAATKAIHQQHNKLKAQHIGEESAEVTG